jgi:hypothetical protein
MRLTLEELDVWADAAEMASLSGNPVAVTSRELKSLIAAARAHLEGQELHKTDAERFWHPQPPQQREDDDDLPMIEIDKAATALCKDLGLPSEAVPERWLADIASVALKGGDGE